MSLFLREGCPECGARLGEGETCNDLFNRMLALEWSLIEAERSASGQEQFLGSATGAVYTRAHFFAVGSYQLQHPDRLNGDALLGLHAAIGDVIAGRRTVAEIRMDNHRAFEGPRSVRRKSGEGRDPALGPWPASWPVTVADCCDVSPEDYPAAVERFAAATASAIDAVRPAAPSRLPPPPPAPRRPRADRKRR